MSVHIWSVCFVSTSKRPLDEEYFEWLVEFSGLNAGGWTLYYNLLTVLYLKPFWWSIDRDENRAEDGKDLRYEFIEATDADRDQDWIELECSIFEFLIGLSIRASFETGLSQEDWFRRLLGNLQLLEYEDIGWNDSYVAEVDDILERLLHRQYAPDGNGGLFPRSNPPEPQNGIEIWYQMHGYIQDYNLWG